MFTARCRTFVILFGILVLTACGGGGGDEGNNPSPPAPPASGPPTFTVGGTISGLAGSGLVLRNSDGATLAVASNGTFTFAVAMASGTSYTVSVFSQPSTPSQTCSVSSGASGTIGSANIANVSVSCVTNTYAVGGTVTGLTASGLVLQNNAGDDLTIASSGAFTFSAALASGSPYAVSIRTQPSSSPIQTCVVNNDTGVVSTAAITSVNVSCSTRVGKFLYVPNSDSSNVSAYAINPTTGALTALSGSPFASATTPTVATADRAGNRLYVANETVMGTPPMLSAYEINASTGALTALPGSPFEMGPPGIVAGRTPLSRPLIHPSGSLGYVGVFLSGELYGAAVDPTSGDLVDIPGLPIEVGGSLNWGTFNAAGTVLYVPHEPTTTVQGLGRVSAYVVNSPSGVLTPIGSVATGGGNPTICILNANGSFMLVPNPNPGPQAGSVAVFAVDPASGALTAVPGSPFSDGQTLRPTHLAIHPTKNFVYVTGASTTTSPPPSIVAAFQLDGATGALTPIAGSPFSGSGNGAVIGVIDPTGKFYYVANFRSNNIAGFSIDQVSGALTAVPGMPFPTGAMPAGIFMDPSGRFLYTANTGANTVSSYAIDPTTGALTLINAVATGTAPSWVEIVGLQ